MQAPQDIQIIGSEVAIRWADGRESYFPAEQLRAATPSAETRGERDIFGQIYGGTNKQDYAGVQVLAWEKVGNYAVRFTFSDGHRTGLYSYDYLQTLAAHS